MRLRFFSRWFQDFSLGFKLVFENCFYVSFTCFFNSFLAGFDVFSTGVMVFFNVVLNVFY